MEKPTPPEDEPQEQRDWASLPGDLLSYILSSPDLDAPAKRAALASCRALAGALLRACWFSLVLDVDREQPLSPTTQLPAQLAGVQELRHGLALRSARRGSPALCLAQLRGVRLAGVGHLVLQVRTAAQQRCGAPEPAASA